MFILNILCIVTIVYCKLIQPTALLYEIKQTSHIVQWKVRHTLLWNSLSTALRQP